MLLCFRNLGYVYTDFTVRHSERLECLSTLSNLVEKDIVFQVIESNLTRSLVHDSTHGCSGNDEIVSLLFHLVICLAVLRHYYQTLFITETLFGCSLNTDNLIAHHLEANLTRTKILVLLQLNSEIITILVETSCLHACGTHQQHC